MYDLIGDIHGFADTLELMLDTLGYKKINGTYTHDKRKIIFAGDFIDRGPNIRKTLQIVRPMIESGSALSVAGNHEFNAIAFYTKDRQGNFLRPHSEKNINQFRKTLEEFKDYPKEWTDYIEWFKSLPLTIETETLRVVHACWEPKLVKIVNKKYPEGLNNKGLLIKAFDKSTEEYNIIETLLKGKEVELPAGYSFKDKDNHRRTSVRYQWWSDLRNKTYKTVAVSEKYNIPDIPIAGNIFKDHKGYAPKEKPLFFGHYWCNGTPLIKSPNVCCLDYSLGKCQKLTAYRFDGEKTLNNKKFISLNCIDHLE